MWTAEGRKMNGPACVLELFKINVPFPYPETNIQHDNNNYYYHKIKCVEPRRSYLVGSWLHHFSMNHLTCLLA